MKIAFYFAHPSQYYVFKNIVKMLERNNHKIFIYIKSKDILEDLLINERIEHKNLLPESYRRTFLTLIKKVILKNYRLFKEHRKHKFNYIVSASSDISQVAKLVGIPSIIFNDDDYNVIKYSALFGWPFSSIILAPQACKMGYWSKKTISYKGYQKLGYLHPNYFQPDESIIKKYNLSKNSYILIRSVSLIAHHDKNVRGLNTNIVKKLIDKLSNYGKVYITSENKLPEELKAYQLKINPIDIHHVLYYSVLLIGDSQSMAHEAALLGIPSIRYNDFFGRIGVLEELEKKYKLTFGISPDNPDKLYQTIDSIMQKNLDSNYFKEKAIKMINEMIDFPKFIVWFIENYPESARIMKENPEFQNNFR